MEGEGQFKSLKCPKLFCSWKSPSLHGAAESSALLACVGREPQVLPSHGDSRGLDLVPLTQGLGPSAPLRPSEEASYLWEGGGRRGSESLPLRRQLGLHICRHAHLGLPLGSSTRKLVVYKGLAVHSRLLSK